jgi:phosphatidylserine/phosphatidylglycerophosphate/cardiolipin synthase-like enzyme
VHFDAMTEVGIDVVVTRLDALQDSNPLWSGIWRWTMRPFGNTIAQTLPNPFGAGRVSIRSYLSLLNFKANHRKLLVTDSADGTLQAIVSSANPHDGSSAHRNVALRFDGSAVVDLLRMESALMEMSGAQESARLLQPWLKQATDEPTDSSINIQMLGESRILDEIVYLLDNADAGTSIDLVMFYLSERSILRAMKRARQRGASIRVLLDVNNDAFGRTKNGVPNRPVAAELTRADIEVRWCATAGEQCHAKWLHVKNGDRHVYLLGSANYTRRNLRDFNLETNVRIEAAADTDLVAEMTGFFEQQWDNTSSETYSLGYEEHADDSVWLMLQYRFMEASGLSTF